MKKISSTDEALMLFEECSIKHGKAAENGDYKQGNKNHDIIIACILYLYDSQQLQLLEPFLEHQDVNVRLWAAFALLTVERTKAEKTLRDVQDVERTKAEKTLRDVQDGPCGIYRSDAMYTLREWESGRLKFPWEWARKH